MKDRGFIAAILFFTAFSAAARSADADIRAFGPKSGPLVAILAPESLLEAIGTDLTANPPEIRVTLVPASREKAFLASAESNSAIAIVLADAADATEGSTTVFAGCRGRTSPAWLLSAVRSGLDAANVPWKLDETRMPLYRLGWTRENPRLAAALAAGLPSIQLAARSYPGGFFADLAARAADGLGTDTDSHFLVLPGNAILSETTMVALMIGASAVILFFLFVFSFLVGKKSDQRLRDFFRVWWLPFIYLAVDVASLTLAQTAISSIVAFRFGERGAWALFPVVSFAAKVGLSWLIGTLVISLNQLVKFPEDGFIYGYIASIVCLVNVFAFASLDFSLSILFLSAYLVSIVAYRFARPAAQVVGIAAVALPFLPYCAALVSGDASDVSSYLAPLYRGDGLWNVRLALLAMPVQLLAARLAHTLGVFGKRTKWYLPVGAIIALAAAVASTATLSLVPAYTAERPLVASVTQTVSGTESSVKVSTPIRFPDLAPVELPSAAAMPALARDSDRIVRVESSARRYLDRRLVTISVRPVVPYDRAEIEITGSGFISVLDSSEPFELRGAGSSSLFSHEMPGSDGAPDAWTVSFSAPADETLSATVRMTSRFNPWGLTVTDENVRADYRLETVSTVPISGSDR